MNYVLIFNLVVNDTDGYLNFTKYLISGTQLLFNQFKVSKLFLTTEKRIFLHFEALDGVGIGLHFSGYHKKMDSFLAN